MVYIAICEDEKNTLEELQSRVSEFLKKIMAEVEVYTNQYESISEMRVRATSKSSQYENDQWVKQYGVLGFLNATIYPNQVGNVQYKYGGTTKITHRENF